MSEDTCHERELVALLDARRAGLRLFGLIDGTADSPSLESFFLLAADAEYEPLFLQTEYASCLPHSPYLFALPTDNAVFLQEWGYQASHGIIWWLSALDLQEQAVHWRSLITALTPARTLAIFRFWDCRVLAPYLQQCSAHEREQLLAPCHTLFAPEDKRYWRIWHGPQNDAPLPQRNVPCWQIQPQHLAAFATAFERLQVDAIEDALWRLEPVFTGNHYAPTLPELIRRGLAQATALGLSSDTALTTFLRCQIRFGTDYWQHSSLTPIWQLPRQREQAFMMWADARLD